MVNSQHPQPAFPTTEYGIPIRNLWHMLLYAWNEVPIKQAWAREAVESAPTLDTLLASILMQLMQQRLRIGLGHDYVEEERKIHGVRGRIQFGESLKQRTLDQGQLICEFHAYGANSLKNQVIRSTLARLLKLGHFGPDPALVKEMHQKLRRLLRDLDGIHFVELSPDLVHRQTLVRNDHDYRLMLSICDLIIQRQMPAGPEGAAVVPVIDRQLLVMYKVYERFVANFYRLHLKGWSVSAQKRLDWHTKEANEHLPTMVPDLTMQEKSTGRMIILDTKYTAHSLVESPWGRPVYDSSHLYQVYAYLRSQEHLSQAHRDASGILLYPAVREKFAEQVKLQDHIIRIESVDLAAPWQDVEKQLLEIVSQTPTVTS